MNQQNLELAKGWINSWVTMDIDWLRESLHSDFVHTSPFGRLSGREHYLDVVEPLARKSVQKLSIQHVIANETQAVIWFENVTANGAVPSCDWLMIEGGKIAAIQSFYDTAKVRQVLTPDEQSELDDKD